MENLDAHLQKNATKLSSKAAFEPYFGTRRTPFKARSSSAAGVTSGDDGEVKSVLKARGRRTTKVKSEEYGHANIFQTHIANDLRSEDDGSASSPGQALVKASKAIARTPARMSLPSPGSPADITNKVGHVRREVATSITDRYHRSGIPERIESLREVCSSVTAVQMTFLFLEAWCLQRQQLPMRNAFVIPSVKLGGFSTPQVPVGLPDFFRLLEPEFWSTSMLWAMTSMVIPLVVSYFFNLRSRHGARTRSSANRYEIDPLTFSIAKAITTFVVYGMYKPLPLFDINAVARVDVAMFYGWKGIVIGSFVGMLTSLYEAAQGK